MKGREFHISGESYGVGAFIIALGHRHMSFLSPIISCLHDVQGHYIPALGAHIASQNLLYPHRTQINLSSVLVGNGYVSPSHTTFGYWETLCTTNPGVQDPIFNATRCDIMASNIPRCLNLAQVCYKNPDPALCLVAAQVCWEGVVVYYDGESGEGGRNRFDITLPCETKDDLCYPEMPLIKTYLNTQAVYKALGVPKDFGEFDIISWPVAEAFAMTNDEQISMQPQVLYML